MTGSPGLPVDSGSLKDSWRIQRLENGNYLISTNKFYAAPVEKGGSKKFQAEITAMNFDLLVAAEVAKLR